MNHEEISSHPKAGSFVHNPILVSIHRHSRLLYCAIAILVFVFDQVTKSMVRKSIAPHTLVPVIHHFFNLTNTSNSGAAFGLFSASPAPWKTAVLILVSLALLAALGIFVWKSVRMEWESGVALALILGGAASNLMDRIRYGRVTDFLDFYIRQYHWFTFNLADSAIVAGAGLLVLSLLADR